MPGGGRGAAQDQPLERARGAAAGGGGKAEGGQRVLQHGEQRDGGQPIGHRAGEQPEEGGGRRIGKRFAGAVVDDHAVAREFGGDAERELPVRGDEGGAGVRAFERVPQGEGDGDALPPAGRPVRDGAGRWCPGVNGARHRDRAVAGRRARQIVSALSEGRRAEAWIPGSSPGMTSCVGRVGVLRPRHPRA